MSFYFPSFQLADPEASSTGKTPPLLVWNNDTHKIDEAAEWAGLDSLIGLCYFFLGSHHIHSCELRSGKSLEPSVQSQRWFLQKRTQPLLSAIQECLNDALDSTMTGSTPELAGRRKGRTHSSHQSDWSMTCAQNLATWPFS